MSGIAKIGSLATRMYARVPRGLPDDPGHGKEDQTAGRTYNHRELLHFPLPTLAYSGVLCGPPNCARLVNHRITPISARMIAIFSC